MIDMLDRNTLESLTDNVERKQKLRAWCWDLYGLTWEEYQEKLAGIRAERLAVLRRLFESRLPKLKPLKRRALKSKTAKRKVKVRTQEDIKQEIKELDDMLSAALD